MYIYTGVGKGGRKRGRKRGGSCPPPFEEGGGIALPLFPNNFLLSAMLLHRQMTLSISI